MIAYVSKVMDDEDKENECDFDEIAVAIEASPDAHLAIILKSKEKEDVSFTSDTYYCLENVSKFNLKSKTTKNVSCILIGPETLVHLMSPREAEKSNSGLREKLGVLEDDADALLDSLPRSINLQNFSYNVKEIINLVEGENIFYLKAFV